MIYLSFWIINVYSWFGFLQDKGWLISQPKSQRAENSYLIFWPCFVVQDEIVLTGKLWSWACKPVPSPQPHAQKDPVLDYRLCCRCLEILIILSWKGCFVSGIQWDNGEYMWAEVSPSLVTSKGIKFVAHDVWNSERLKESTR